MPRLNGRGQALTGVAGGLGAIDGVVFPFPTYGGGAWEDDDTVITARQPDAMLVRWRPADGPEPVLIEPARGANAIAGGGGKFLAIWIQDHGESLLYGAVGVLPLAGFGDIAEDGTVAYKTVYQSDHGVTVIDPEGHTSTLPDANGDNLHALPGGRAIWRGGALGRPPVRAACPTAANVRLAVVGGIDWLLYWANGVGLVVQVDGARDGYILETRGIAYNSDLRNVDGTLHVAWSQTPQELPGDLVTCTVTTEAVRFLIDPQGAARSVPVKVPLPPPAPKHTPSAGPFATPLHVGYFFKYSTQYGDNPRAPGNVSIVTDPGAATRAVGRIIPAADPATLAVAATRWSDVVALYCPEEASQSALEAQAAAAILWMAAQHLPRRPIVSYSGPHRWVLKNVDWTGVQLYVNVADDPGTWDSITTTYTREFSRWIDEIPADRSLALICQAYGRNFTPGTNEQAWSNQETLTALQAIFNEVARVYAARVRLVAWFSDGRPTGTRDNEYLRPWHAALAGAQGGLPPILTLDPPAPPRPVPPRPVPPPPPIPKPSPIDHPFGMLKGLHLMEPLTVDAVGPAGFYARVDPRTPTKILFDATSPTDHTECELTKPDDLYVIRFKAANVIINFAPKWQCGTDLNRQFETRPVDARGHDEMPFVGTPDAPFDDMMVAFVVHERDGRKFPSAPLNLVKR